MAKYAVRDIIDATLYDLTTNLPVIKLDYLQTSSQTLGTEIVYARGGRGAPKLVGFQSNNAMTMEMTSALLTPELLAIMFGNTVSTGAQYVRVSEVIAATSEVFNITSTPYTGDLTNYPITCAYAPDSSVPETNLTKVVSSTPASDEFDVTARVVTVNSGTYSAGGNFLVTYYKTAAATTKRVQFKTDNFTKAYRIHGYTTWRNEADSLDYECAITIPKFQFNIDGAVLNSVMEGDPTTLVLSGEALKPSTGTDLITYDILET
jgi:hypothetical protein